ncbi:MAG: hypothetical protein ACFE8E_11890 [Candidatus Hodarchaeota archaeon]
MTNDRKKQISKLRKAAKKLRSLAKKKMRKNLSPAESDQISQYIDWLIDSSNKLISLANQLESATEEKIEEVNEAISKMQAQLLQQAQNKMAVMMQTISNLMKNIHDTANAIINNMR